MRVSSRPSSDASFWISCLRSVDEIAAALGVLAVLEAVPNRPGTAADAIAGFDDGDRGAEGLQVTSGSEPREPCARHKD